MNRTIESEPCRPCSGSARRCASQIAAVAADRRRAAGRRRRFSRQRSAMRTHLRSERTFCQYDWNVLRRRTPSGASFRTEPVRALGFRGGVQAPERMRVCCVHRARALTASPPRDHVDGDQALKARDPSPSVPGSNRRNLPGVFYAGFRASLGSWITAESHVGGVLAMFTS